MKIFTIVNTLIDLANEKMLTFYMRDEKSFEIFDARLGGSTIIDLIHINRVEVKNKSLGFSKICDNRTNLESAIRNILTQMEAIDPLEYAAKVIASTSKRFNTIVYETDELGRFIVLADQGDVIHIRVTETSLSAVTTAENAPQLTLSFDNTETELLYHHAINAANVIDQI